MSHDSDDFLDTVAFRVPDDVPHQHVTAQLPEGERVAGTCCIRLYDPTGLLAVHEHRAPVDAEGVIDLAAMLPPGMTPGVWTLKRGPLLRSMTLLPLR
jgi:hypothetical protein